MCERYIENSMPCTDCSCTLVFWRLKIGTGPDPLVLSLQTVNCVLNLLVVTFSTSDTFQVQIFNKNKMERINWISKADFKFVLVDSVPFLSFCSGAGQRSLSCNYVTVRLFQLLFFNQLKPFFKKKLPLACLCHSATASTKCTRDDTIMTRRAFGP